MNADTTILVGVSGSPASLAALRWAGDEAVRRGCQLRIVLTWQREQRASYAGHDARGGSTERCEQASRVLVEAVSAVLGTGPWHDTTVEAVEGQTERVLVAASEDADLLVLGSGHAAMIGPVVRACLAEAQCPVVVVSRRARPTGVSSAAAPPATRRAAVAASR
jgi:nucleotide-binding universal stress UspA family protein